MKTLYFSLVALLFVCVSANSSLAQSRWTSYDAVTFGRIGLQGLDLRALNQALQQAGYTALATQTQTIGIGSQFSHPNYPLGFHTEAGISTGLGSTSANGLYKAQAIFYYVKLGASYRIIRTNTFELAPQLSLAVLPFHLDVSPKSSGNPSLNTVLTNPGSAQTATYQSGALGLDAGLVANLWVPHSQRQVDCLSTERSLVVSLDAGYRLAGSPSRIRYDASSANPAIQLSGWYAGLRLGLGLRVRTTKSPVSN